MTFGQLVGGPRSHYSYELLMEIRAEDEVFKTYKKGGGLLYVCEWVSVLLCVCVCVYPTTLSLTDSYAYMLPNVYSIAQLNAI